MIVYKITNKISNKIYIGQTTRKISNRIAEHKCKNSLVGEAIKQYGTGNFSFEIVEKCNSRDELNAREEYWINYYGSIYPNGYNKAIVDAKFGEFNGFYDRHHKPDTIQNNKEHQPNRRKVFCIETGELFDSVRECERETGISRTQIIRICSGRILKTKKLHFMYG